MQDMPIHPWWDGFGGVLVVLGGAFPFVMTFLRAWMMPSARDRRRRSKIWNH
jgi:hypothetical protein